MARWGDERTIQFIHLYREYECLWKPTSSLYKNKIARANAYTKIQEELNVTEKEIKNKIKSLRSTYHQEKNKVENSKRSGAGSSDIYKPSLTWYKEMEFINESFEYRKSIQIAVVQTASQVSTETETQTPPSYSQRGTASDQQSSSQTSTAAVNPPNNETFNDAVDQSQSSAQASTTNKQAPSPSQKNTAIDQQFSSRTVNRPHKTCQNKRQRVEPNETLTALQRLENIATAINNPRSNEKQKDEFYYFGQSVAAQLRSLPLNNALDVQSKIQVLLSTERSGLSTSYSQPSTPYSINSEETAVSSADHQFIHTIPYTHSNTTEDNTFTFGQESGQNIFNQAWNNA